MLLLTSIISMIYVKNVVSVILQRNLGFYHKWYKGNLPRESVSRQKLGWSLSSECLPVRDQYLASSD